MKNRKLSAIMYAISYLGIAIVGHTSVKWYQYFYTPPELNQGGLQTLIPISLIGLAMIVGRVFDGIADPLVAYYSDNSKSKLGRRIPFILYGTVPMIVTFVLLWFPPFQGESIWNFIYLSIMLSLFFIFFTIVVAPYLALIGEISKSKEERINLTMLQGITQVVGLLIAEAGSAYLIDTYNFRVMGLVLGLIALVTLLLTPIFVKEEEQVTVNRETMGLFTSVRKTLENRNFVYYLISNLTIWFGINTLTIAMPYISEILLEMKAETSGFMIGGAFIMACLVSLFVPKVSLRYGKKRTMVMASILFGILLMVTGLFGTVLTGIWAIAIVLMVGIPLAATFTIPNAMVADIAEYDGIVNGVRREGMFFGAQGLINKFVIGLSSFVTPFVFRTFGYSQANPLGLQLSGPIAGLTILLGVYFLNKYSLVEEDIEQAKGLVVKPQIGIKV